MAITFKVRIKDTIGCRETPYHNIALFNYTLPTSGRERRLYDGTLAGLIQDDVRVSCTTMEANADNFVSSGVTQSGTEILNTTSFQVLSNDTLSGVVLSTPSSLSLITAPTLYTYYLSGANPHIIAHNTSGNPPFTPTG